MGSDRSIKRSKKGKESFPATRVSSATLWLNLLLSAAQIDRGRMKLPSVFFSLFVHLAAGLLAFPAAGFTPDIYSDQHQPLNPTGGRGLMSPAPNTVPAFPVVQAFNQSACRLDLSDELFGGLAEACGHGGLDRSRCCPVLAAWLFAAHARSALEVRPSPAVAEDWPVMPDDSQRCVDALQSSLEARNILLPRPNATCDAVLCFCGIRLHQIGSLTCPAAFNVSVAGGNATPTSAVRRLERHCRNASYAGCTRCLHSLQNVKGGNSGGDRASKMFERDCQLMGLTWLLARNKTVYIPTVSAVLRALMYSDRPVGQTYRCSPDQENMPLAVDSLQFQKSYSSDAAPVKIIYYLPILLLLCHVLLSRRT